MSGKRVRVERTGEKTRFPACTPHTNDRTLTISPVDYDGSSSSSCSGERVGLGVGRLFVWSPHSRTHKNNVLYFTRNLRGEDKGWKTQRRKLGAELVRREGSSDRKRRRLYLSRRTNEFVQFLGGFFFILSHEFDLNLVAK